MSSKRQVYDTPQFRVLSQDECEAIYSSSLEVLERTGVRIQHDGALSLLKEAGAGVNDNVAHIPPHLVEEAIREAPQKILVYNREGKPCMRLEGTNYYFGTGSDCPNIIDSFSGEFRKFTTEDIGQAAVLADALPNIDFIMSMGLISDKPMWVTDLCQFQQMLFNSKKPIVFTCHDAQGNKDIIEMASIVAGDKQELSQRPFIIHYIEPSSPLSHSKEAVEKLLLCAQEKVPIIYTPCPSGGGTAPVTLAGNLVLALAESLSGVVLSQLKRKGAPVIIGGVITGMDMRTATYCYGAPEFHLMSAALAQVCQFLDIPMFGTAGCSDSKILDEQAAIEASLSIALQALSGANLIHDVGYIGSGLIGSFDMLVMSNEIIAMAKRIMRGIPTQEEHLCVDLIDKVGPRGSYLAEEHTLNYFKKEHWRPELMDRSDYQRWSGEGSKNLGQRVNGKVKSILEKHKPEPIPEDKAEKIMKLIAREEKSRKVEY